VKVAVDQLEPEQTHGQLQGRSPGQPHEHAHPHEQARGPLHAQLQRVAAGDGQAFRVLYDTFAPRVYQYAMLRTGCAADAEEVLQETMLAVWNGRSLAASRDAVGAWILGIARNKTVDLLRRKRLRQTLALDETLASAAVDGDDPAELIDAKNALARLDENEQDLVLMVFLWGMTYEEVGEALGIPAGTVKSRMHHLRRKLKKGLEEAHGDAIV